MALITRTVVSSPEHSTYVTVDSVPVIPECITRFDPGTRVEVRKVRGNQYAVIPVEGNSLRVFGEELWRAAV